MLYLIDATAFCYRAFYAIGDLRTSYGQPTNAVYGFVNILNKLLKEKKPEYLAVCFDVSRKTFRQERLAEYKIQRPPMPEGLSGQIPLIKTIVAAYGITLVEKEGYEADDLIATLNKRAKENGFMVMIVSSDKDMLQLVDGHTFVFNPYKDDGVTYDKKMVLERLGVPPQRVTDLIALMGDAADNIPGVRGIGEKTAARLIQDFKSLEQLLKNLDKIKSESLRDALRDNIAKINLNKEIAQLDSQVDIAILSADLKIKPANYRELYRIFNQLEFKSLAKGLPVFEVAECEKEKQEARRLTDFLGQIKENSLVLFSDTKSPEIHFYNGEKIYCQATLKEAREILEDAQIKKIGYDLKKLAIFLKGKDISLEGGYFDVMIAAYLSNPSWPDYHLESLTWNYLSLALREIDASRAPGFIARLKIILEKELKEKHLERLFYNIEMPLLRVLTEIEAAGVRIDQAILERISQEVATRLNQLTEEIYNLSGEKFNLDSPKQLRGVLFDKLKLPVFKKTKTGPSTDEEVLRSLASDHKIATLLLEYRQLAKLKSTYIDVLPELINPETGRIHACFSQVATQTGRLACSQPNLQNLPVKSEIGRRIREAVIAPSENDYLVSADYSQIELRLLAHLSQDSALITAFRQGKDIHKATAALIYKVEESAVLDEMREVAKRINFGIIYGLSPYGLAHDLQISLVEAEGFIADYFLRYPKVKEYLESQIVLARQRGFVMTLLGRRRYIPQIENKNTALRNFAERQAVNTPIQGSAADLIKQAMVDLYRAISQQGLSCRMILQIHDELLFEVKKTVLPQALFLIRDKMENVIKLDIPIRVEIKVGKNWAQLEEIKEKNNLMINHKEFG